jgi:hypothetical protein
MAWKLGVVACTCGRSVGIDNPPVPKTDTQEKENLDKAIFS